MSYSEIIKDLMIEKNLSQDKIAKILNVNQTTISQWLKGTKKPSWDSITKIYEEFAITPNELFNIK